MSRRLDAIEARLTALEHDLALCISMINRVCATLTEDGFDIWEDSVYRRYNDLELPPYPDPGIAPEVREVVEAHAALR